jgi:non-homologous end joining protein Ku
VRTNEVALAEVVKAKLEGKKIEFAKESRRGKVDDLMAAF